MSREKQEALLEFEKAEMLEIIEKAREIYANDITDHTENEYIREGLLDAGYRKQEWISVDERLPEQYVSVLAFCKIGVTKLQCVSEMIEPNGKKWSAVCGLPVTHWMPLPEPPKMKGGEG